LVEPKSKTTTATERALIAILEKVSTQHDLPTTICQALPSSTSVSQLEYLCTNVLGDVGILTLTTAICCGWHTKTELQLFAIETLAATLQHQPPETLVSLNHSLKQLISFAVLSNEEFRQRLELRLDPLLDSIMGDEGVTASDSSTAAAGMAERTAPDRVTTVLAEFGPASTQTISQLRELLSPLVPLNEGGVAHLLYFVSQQDTEQWNLTVVASVLATDYVDLDWGLVAQQLDFTGMLVATTKGFVTLLTLYAAGAKKPLPFDTMVLSKWDNGSGQLSLIENALSVPPSVYTFRSNDEEALDAATAGDVTKSSCPNAQGWASTGVLELFLKLSDDPSLARRVRDLFVKGLLSCPEVLLCALEDIP